MVSLVSHGYGMAPPDRRVNLGTFRRWEKIGTFYLSCLKRKFNWPEAGILMK